MNRIRPVAHFLLAGGIAVAPGGCEKEVAPPPTPPESAARPAETSMPAQPKSPATPPAMPPNHPAVTGAENTGATIEGTTLRLTGVSLALPEGWESEAVSPSPMAPVAILRIPKTSPDGENGTVRVTYFPNMKGMDESNIQRWIGQVTKADGQPTSREDAAIKMEELGNVRLTTVDLTGSIKLTMRDSPKPDMRMIAAIVDHPRGPHFVVAAGDVKSMESWAHSIRSFLKSARVE